MKEVFKDIKGYEGLFQVSNLGNVKSLNYLNTGQEKILHPSITKYGYLFVSLRKDRKSKIHSIHRLVAETFIPNLLKLRFVIHKDENKFNNSVKNLKWCANQYGIEYCWIEDEPLIKFH